MNAINLAFGDVRRKNLKTPNHFVTHMIEHILWRMGLAGDLTCSNDNWLELGKNLGTEIRKFTAKTDSSIAFGMIDDGSSVVTVDYNTPTRVSWSAKGGVNLERFHKLRCEQLENGSPLISLLDGISAGLNVAIHIEIWSLKDAHHTWEGIFRGLGICLCKIYAPIEENQKAVLDINKDNFAIKEHIDSEISVLEKGIHTAVVRRGTAETGITVSLNLRDKSDCQIIYEVDESIINQVKEFDILLTRMMKPIGGSLKINFKALSLSSSHVVMEDIGLVLGRAFLEILKLRMEKYGVNAAGSNLSKITDLQNTKVNIGVSVEGRKFWEFIPYDGDFVKLQNAFLLDSNILSGLRSEDLDEFFDGLSGGMSASIMIHIKDYCSANDTWQEVFTSLGQSLNEVLSVNTYRKGVPPGVKATLA